MHLSFNNNIFSFRHIWKRIKKRKKENAYVLHNNVKVLTFLEKRINEISLRYTARSLNNFCVLSFVQMLDDSIGLKTCSYIK